MTYFQSSFLSFQIYCSSRGLTELETHMQCNAMHLSPSLRPPPPFPPSPGPRVSVREGLRRTVKYFARELERQGEIDPIKPAELTTAAEA